MMTTNSYWVYPDFFKLQGISEIFWCLFHIFVLNPLFIAVAILNVVGYFNNYNLIDAAALNLKVFYVLQFAVSIS
jgi:hypothetical protein